VSDAQGDRPVAVGKQGAIVHVDWQPIRDPRVSAEEIGASGLCSTTPSVYA
jgi:hypothetical protein